MTLNEFLNHPTMKNLGLTKVEIEIVPNRPDEHYVSYYFSTGERFRLSDFDGNTRKLVKKFEDEIVNQISSRQEVKQRRRKRLRS